MRRLTLLLGLASACSRPGPAPVHTAEVDRILRDERYAWVTLAAGSTRMHFPSGSYADANRAVVADRAKASWSAVLRALGEPGFADPVDLFYVDSRQDMENLTGSPVAGFAYFHDSAVVLVFNADWRAFERHELTHVVTLGKWRNPAGPAVVEGLATHVDGECGGYPNGRAVRTMLDAGALLPMETLAGDFRGQDDLVAYLQAAATIDFVVRRLGSDAIRALWDRGLETAPDLLALPVADFESEFESWIRAAFEPVPALAWEAIRDGGCGIEASRSS